MYIDPFRAPEFSKIGKEAQEYQPNFLVTGCQAAANVLKSIFGTLIAVVHTAGRSIVRFLHASVLEPKERRAADRLAFTLLNWVARMAAISRRPCRD